MVLLFNLDTIYAENTRLDWDEFLIIASVGRRKILFSRWFIPGKIDVVFIDKSKP